MSHFRWCARALPGLMVVAISVAGCTSGAESSPTDVPASSAGILVKGDAANPTATSTPSPTPTNSTATSTPSSTPTNSTATSSATVLSSGTPASTLPGKAVTIAVLNGSGLSAPAGAVVNPTGALMVKILDAVGNPRPGEQVVFAVTGGGGSLASSSAAATSSIDGTVTVPPWKLGPTAGINTLTATLESSSGITATMTATSTPPAVTASPVPTSRQSSFATPSGKIVLPKAVIPAAPVLTNVLQGDRSATIDFTLDASTGSPSNVEYSLDQGQTWVPRSPASLASPIVIGNLTNGTIYGFFMRAVGPSGSGPSSNGVTVAPAAPQALPGAVQITNAYRDPLNISSGGLEVVISPPANVNPPILGYRYRVDTQGSLSVWIPGTWKTTTLASVSPALLRFTIPQGSSIKQYAIQVRAYNSVGDGALSNTYYFNYGQLDPPRIFKVTGGDGKVTVDFNLPGPFASRPVLGLEYNISGGNWKSAPSTQSPLVVSGLQNGQTYTIRLRVIEAKGVGAESAGYPFSTINVPGAPTITKITPTPGQLRVEFTPPQTDGGAPITGYTYSISGTSPIVASPAVTTSPMIIKGNWAQKGQYTVSVRIAAVNKVGTGPFSNLVVTSTQ